MKTTLTLLVLLCTLHITVGGTLNIRFPNNGAYLVIVNGQPHFANEKIALAGLKDGTIALSILSYHLDLDSRNVSTKLITENILSLSKNESLYLSINEDKLINTGSGTATSLHVDASNYHTQEHHGYHCGMPRAMSKEAFNSFRSHIASKRFDSSMLDAIKKSILKPTLNCAQLKSLMQLFAFDSGKIELAKFGYSKVIDPENFVIIYDVFRFNSSGDELRRYLNH